MRLRVIIPPELDPDAALDLIAKALKQPLALADRALAKQDATELQAEFSGLMERVLPQYQESYALLQSLIPQARGQRRRDLIDQRDRLKDRTAYNVRVLFNRYYRDQFLNGKQTGGNGRPLQANEREIIRRTVNNEVEYLLNALIDAETGEFRMPLEERGQLYGNALGEARWGGWLYADLSQNRYVRWVLGKGEGGEVTESCPDCLWLAGRLDLLQAQLMAMAAKKGGTLTPAQQRLWRIAEAAKQTQGGRWGTGVYRAQELAHMSVYPQSGGLACTTRCHCHLANVLKPKTAPKGPEATSWTSLVPKAPLGTGRVERVEERERLGRLLSGWQAKHVKRR